MNSFDVLKEIFPGQIDLPVLAVGKAIGLAGQTTKNKVCEGTFPIRVLHQGRKRVCHILDVAAYLDEQRTGEKKKRRGRPTKAEVMARDLVEGGK